MSNSGKLAPEAVGVKTIPTRQLFPNPHNPRLLFDREPMGVLKASIDKVGILVPLTVYWEKAKRRYVILDGQRRWMCAKDLELDTVPVNVVAEPTLVQNIVTMFQIHKLREDWELMPTALKLEVLMKALNEKGEKKLSALTGLDQAVVSRCKKLLSYPKKYQDMMLDPNPRNRIKADFFIELYAVRSDRFVNSMSWFKKDEFTRRMLQKYLGESETIRAVTDFRTIKQHINNARKAGKKRVIEKKLNEFTYNESRTIDHLIIKSADVSAYARHLTNSVEKTRNEIYGLDVDEYYGETKLWDAIEDLWREAGSKLRAVGRRLR